MDGRESVSVHHPTWLVAEVGNTRMWVQDTSWGVESWQLTDVWLNLSSGVNWSGISRSAESGSSDTRHALNTHGTSLGYIRLHCSQISFKCFEAFRSDLRLSSQLQPTNKQQRNIKGCKHIHKRKHMHTLNHSLSLMNGLATIWHYSK
jgi:hypothetical protein